MNRNRYLIAGGVIAFLVLANILYYGFSSWGLITIKVQNVPLSQVVKSIEWQGWVRIYTNIDPTTKISMYVENVTLPEALETLSANAGGQWKLGFFVGPTSTDVKETIKAFEAGSMGNMYGPRNNGYADNTQGTPAATPDTTLRIYSYPTMLGMLASSGNDDDSPSMSVADPRLQTWPGMQAMVVPVSTAPAPATDPSNSFPAPAPPAPPDSVQGYLRAFAQSADISIISNTSWDPPVAKPPPASSSIASAIKNFVSNNHGAVAQAFVLQGGRGGFRGGGFRRGGFAGGDDTGWSERLQNAINGLPENERAGALAQLDQEAKFQKDVQAAPPDQRRDMMRQHMQGKMADNLGGPMGRMSPDKRAQRYQQMVATRMAAQGK